MTAWKHMTWGRVRVPLVWAAISFLIANAFVELVPFWVAALAFLAAMALYLRLGAPPDREPVGVEAPVRGRWQALNSPADKVPSHGLHAYGQTYAIDLVLEPADGSRPGFGWWPAAVPPQRFPGFGAEVLAPANGIVIATRDGWRDHWSRNSWPALALMVAEGVRELLGPSAILGNHVVLDLGGGVYAVAAHLQRRSVPVAVGDRVAAGEPIGRCGNSGNSSEPHLHFQLMDHPRVAFADGIPFRFPFGVPPAATPFVA